MSQPPSTDAAPPPTAPHRPPGPIGGGPLTFIRFALRHRMYGWRYQRMFIRLIWLKLRLRSRLELDGICFVESGVELELGRNAVLRLGRWSWVGRGTKIRVHEGEVELGAKSVIGQECTISAYQSVSIGRECVIADRVMLIDFDHAIDDVERPIRTQGIVKDDVAVGHNCWIGYGVCILRGVSVGENCVLAAGAVVTRSVPDNAIVGGVPGRVLRMRDAPATMRWE